MIICLEQGADLHLAQLMPLPLTVSCFSKIQIGSTFLVPAHLGSPGNGPLNGCVYVCVCVCVCGSGRRADGDSRVSVDVRRGATTLRTCSAEVSLYYALLR